MKMKYIMLLAALMFAVAAPQAEAAPKKKGKKAKTEKVSDGSEFDVLSIGEVEAEHEAKKAEKEAAEAEANKVDTRTGAERREDNEILKEETKLYISNQKKTLKILRSVRNEKSAAKAVKPLEKIYGEVIDAEAASGTVTALGTVKVMEEEEENLPVHQASRATAAALNKAINKELARISTLAIEHKKFNGAIKNMIDQQRN